MADVQEKNAHTKKVIFADFAVSKYSALSEKLIKDGMVADSVTDEKKFISRISEESFDICVVNLLLSGIGPFELIRNVRKVSKNAEIKIIVVSKQVQKMNIQNTIKAGANDFIADPVDIDNLHNRIIYHLTPKKIIANLGFSQESVGTEAWPFLNVLLEATESLSRTAPEKIAATFYEILCHIARLLVSNRTSLMITDEETDSAVVLATSDDPKFSDFPVVLSKYPEVLDVIHSGSFVLIDDVSKNALTNQINDSVKTISIGSMMVFPIRYAGEMVGVLTVRRSKASDLPSMDSLRVLQSLANILAAHSNMKAALRRIYKDYKPTKTA